MNIIFPEKEFGRGCDIVEVIGNSKFYRFIEIKRSTLGLDDVNDDILKTYYNRYKESI